MKLFISSVIILLVAFIFYYFRPETLVNNPARENEFSLRIIRKELARFHSKCGRFPTSKQGLEILESMNCKGESSLEYESLFDYESDGNSYTLKPLEN